VDDRALIRLIRRSPILDAPARRHWLAVLPHLTPDDRERLQEILEDLTPQPRLRRGEGEHTRP